MCGKHYRLGDLKLRRLRAKVLRKAARGKLRWHFAGDMANRLWDRIKEQAVTRG